MKTSNRIKNAKTYSMMAEYIGQRIKDARLYKGMPLTYLSKCTNLSASFLCDVEHGNVLPSLIAYSIICYHLDIEPEIPKLNEF